MKLLSKLGKLVHKAGKLVSSDCPECCDDGTGPGPGDPPCTEFDPCYYKGLPCPGTERPLGRDWYMDTRCFERPGGGGGCLGIDCMTFRQGPKFKYPTVQIGHNIVDCGNPRFTCCGFIAENNVVVPSCVPGCTIQPTANGSCCCTADVDVEISWSLNHRRAFGPITPQQPQRNYQRFEGGGLFTYSVRNGVCVVTSGLPKIKQTAYGLINGQPGEFITEYFMAVGFFGPLCMVQGCGTPPPPGYEGHLCNFMPNCFPGCSATWGFPQGTPGFIGAPDQQDHYTGYCSRTNPPSCYDFFAIDGWEVHRPENSSIGQEFLEIISLATIEIHVIPRGRCGGGCAPVAFTLGRPAELPAL